MKKLLILCTACLCVLAIVFLTVNARPAKKTQEQKEEYTPSAPAPVFLAGNEAGLFSIHSTTGGAALLWQEASVSKIIRKADYAGVSTGNAASAGWYFLTGKGVVFSENLSSFETRNSGLPFRTMKKYRDGEAFFEKAAEDLKDLNVLQGNPDVLVTATNESVFLSQDGGARWEALGRNALTDGIKTAAVAMTKNEGGAEKLTVFISHPIYGVSYLFPGDANRKWTSLNEGLDSVPGMESPDEIAAISVSPDGADIYASQSFIPALYKLNWEEKRFEKIGWTQGFADSFEGLTAHGGKDDRRLFFTALNGIKMYAETGGENSGAVAADGNENTRSITDVTEWNRFIDTLPKTTLCFYVPPEKNTAAGSPDPTAATEPTTPSPTGLSFSHLWLLHPERINTPHAEKAVGKKGIYVPVWQATTDEGLNRHLDVIKQNNLNMLVIDMKDDYGFLRYDAQDPLVLQKGRTGRGIKLDSFVKKAKEAGVYLVARIVVFKDRELSRYDGGKYAVWDKAENKAWRGYELVDKPVEETEQKTGGENPPGSGTDGENQNARPEKIRKYYDEFWVDPYSEEVWEYTAAVAKELITRGFDEIQFDYIRFPTDGVNLKNALYRWQSDGMGKEDALVSFLAYARREINAPISIDIYGANGWYRTGARTGQHMEILAKYVDVICPMFYPSHFENSFLAYPPAVERPYRIYYYGTFRNTVIAKGLAFVRPWAQAFYLNVAYDRQYYNEHYVRQQVFGVRDSLNLGYTYWNNSGRYTDLRPDPAMSDIYTGESPEAAQGLPKPFYAPKP